ncbi:MAG: N-acetylmuramoyl-L-alanine amidase [Candidatus Saganbacteria bacterium]|nr:N-acetylmuramoyl-L-alanine amidase [Candidatus Saganbacteria bacterium]
MLKRTLLFGLLIVLMLPVRANRPEIKLVQAMRDRGFDYLDIYTTAQVKAKGLLLEDQLLIDFPDTGISSDLRLSKRLLKNSQRVKDIKVIQVDARTARVIIDLKKGVDYDIVNVFGRNKNVIEISDRQDRAERIMAAWEKQNLTVKGEELKPEKYKAAVAAKGGKLPLEGRTIVIDPGHGGRDPGAISKHGIPEKNINLAVARKVAYLLKSAGATVYLTRKNDRTNNLRDIVAFADRIKSDIFISIHFNYSDIESINGTETYYYKKNSRNLALILHKSLINGIKRKDRGLRRAKYYAISHTDMPAVLLEPLYLSNWQESKLASSDNFQAEIARDIAAGVKNYFRSRSN